MVYTNAGDFNRKMIVSVRAHDCNVGVKLPAQLAEVITDLQETMSEGNHHDTLKTTTI